MYTICGLLMEYKPNLWGELSTKDIMNLQIIVWCMNGESSAAEREISVWSVCKVVHILNEKAADVLIPCVCGYKGCLRRPQSRVRIPVRASLRVRLGLHCVELGFGGGIHQREDPSFVFLLFFLLYASHAAFPADLSAAAMQHASPGRSSFAVIILLFARQTLKCYFEYYEVLCWATSVNCHHCWISYRKKWNKILIEWHEWRIFRNLGIHKTKFFAFCTQS